MKPPITPAAGPLGPQQSQPHGEPPSFGQPAPQPGQGRPPAPGNQRYGGYPPYPSEAAGSGGPPYPAGDQQYDGHYPPKKAGLNTYAALGLLFGVVGWVPLSIAFGLTGLSQIRRTGQRGKFYAFTGLALTCGWIVIGVHLFLENQDAGRDPAGQVTAPENVPATKLRVGDCVAQIDEGEQRQVRAQPCAQPHWGQVFAAFELPAGAFAGDASTAAAAETGCTVRYAAIKEQTANSPEVFYLHPTAEGWRQGDRAVTCLATSK